MQIASLGAKSAPAKSLSTFHPVPLPLWYMSSDRTPSSNPNSWSTRLSDFPPTLASCLWKSLWIPYRLPFVTKLHSRAQIRCIWWGDSVHSSRTYWPCSRFTEQSRPASSHTCHTYLSSRLFQLRLADANFQLSRNLLTRATYFAFPVLSRPWQNTVGLGRIRWRKCQAVRKQSLVPASFLSRKSRPLSTSFSMRWLLFSHPSCRSILWFAPCLHPKYYPACSIWCPRWALLWLFRFKATSAPTQHLCTLAKTCIVFCSRMAHYSYPIIQI